MSIKIRTFAYQKNKKKLEP